MNFFPLCKWGIDKRWRIHWRCRWPRQETFIKSFFCRRITCIFVQEFASTLHTKVKSRVLSCLPPTSKADVDGMTVEVELSRYFSKNGAWHDNPYEAEVCNWIPPSRGKNTPVDIHRRLLNVYGNQIVDSSTVKRRLTRCSDICDKPCKVWVRTVVAPTK